MALLEDEGMIHGNIIIDKWYPWNVVRVNGTAYVVYDEWGKILSRSNDDRSRFKKECARCLKPFLAGPKKIFKRKKYCSRKCYLAASRDMGLLRAIRIKMRRA